MFGLALLPNQISRDGLKFVYIGTSGFSIHKHMLEHIKCVGAKNVSNALGKHVALHHQYENAEFETEVIRSGIKYNLERFIFEALEIENARSNPDYNMMNSRSEWGGKGLPRIVIQN